MSRVPGDITRTSRPTGERTRAQSGVGALAGVPVAVSGRHPAVTNPSRLPNMTGYNAGRASGPTPGLPPAPPGSYDVYRLIASDPTVALARAVVFGPILNSAWSFTKRDKDVPDEWVDFIKHVYDPMQASLKTQMLRALDFGHRSFEQVYGPEVWEGRVRTVVKKMKPLRPDVTGVRTVRETGAFAGLRNGNVDLEPEECLHIGHEVEDDDWYGRSRHENIREDAWWPWKCMSHTAARLGRKVSSIIPIVKGPISAVEYDKDGKEISGFTAGQLVLDALTYGDGVMVENLVAAVDDIAAHPELAKASKWVLESFDTGSGATAMDGIIDSLRYYDALKMRGWLRPERTATEGQHGTKSEVEEQADVGLAEGEQVHQLMAQAVSWHSVDRLLVWNFGERARGAVFIEPAPLIDERRSVFRWLFTALLANPGVIDLIASRIDIDAMADQLGIPKTGPINPDVEDEAVTPGAEPRMIPRVAPAGDDDDGAEDE